MTLSGWEAAFFWVFAIAALVAALLTILARNAVHSALFLISTLVAEAALVVLLGEEFIAGVQILVYVGGVMVLFLFVIMLVNVGAEERGNEMLFNRPAQVATSVVFLVLLSFGFLYAIRRGYEGMLIRDNLGTREQRAEAASARRERQQDLRLAETGTSRLSEDTQLVGASLYRFAALPFEIASVLLLVAIIGSVMLARTSKQEAAAGDIETARED